MKRSLTASFFGLLEFLLYKFLFKMLPAPEYYAIATTAADWVTKDILTSQS